LEQQIWNNKFDELEIKTSTQCTALTTRRRALMGDHIHRL
jgi:hypothetical protein